jgi:hypothetical protein
LGSRLRAKAAAQQMPDVDGLPLFMINCLLAGQKPFARHILGLHQPKASDYSLLLGGPVL